MEMKMDENKKLTKKAASDTQAVPMIVRLVTVNE